MAIVDFSTGIELFDESDATEPDQVVQGDTLTWTRASTDYPGTDGWVLAYVLNSPTARFVVNPSDIIFADGVFTILIPAAETKNWTPGNYQWIAAMQQPASGGTPAQRFTVGLGFIAVSFDLLDATSPQDTRSPNELALENINNMLAGRGSDGVQEYTINGRMLKRYTLTELMQLRSLYASLVRQERTDQGQPQLSRTVSVHFGG